jgi:serine/threonine protein kinase
MTHEQREPSIAPTSVGDGEDEQPRTVAYRDQKGAEPGTAVHRDPNGARRAAPQVTTRVAQPTMEFSTRYVEGEMLGEGGMGAVRTLYDTVIGREIAMKVIKSEHRNRSEMAARFLREARVQGQLEHPAIVPVHEVGTTPEGDVYFTMKRLRGTTLSAAIVARRDEPNARSSSALRRMLSAFGNVCLAVDFAHSRGVVHRDLKPDNIVLGDFGEVYVLDWGIAKIQDSAERDPIEQRAKPLEVTLPGSVLGTLAYMAPEQARGDLEHVDRRSDVYSLGVILFEILALERLHRAKSYTELAFSALNPPDRSPARRAPSRDVAVELDAVVLKATEVDRDARFATARELAEAIERYLDGDRDVERRREAAGHHATRAKEAIARAFDERAPPQQEQSARSEAMREIGSALGLDATNGAAKDALVELLATPMRAFPKEASAALDDAQRARMQQTAAWGALGFGAIVGILPLVLWMGVQRPALVATLFAMMAIASLSYARVARGPRARASMPVAVIVCSFVGLLLVGGVGGPLWFTPMLAIANGMGLVLSMRREQRALIVALSVLPVLIPLGLSFAGVIPRMYEFVGGVIVVRPWLVAFPPTAALASIALFSVLLVGASVLLGGAFRDMLAQADERQVLHAWQLQQLVRDAAPATTLSGDGPRASSPL